MATSTPLSFLTGGITQALYDIAGIGAGAGLGAGLGYGLAKEKEKKLAMAIGAVAGGAIGGLAANAFAPKSSSGSGSVSPQISVTPTNFQLAKQTGLTGNTYYTYQPTSMLVTGTGFTQGLLGLPGGKVQIIRTSTGAVISSINASTDGGFSVTVPLTSFNPVPGSESIYAIDVHSGTKSNSVPVTYTLSSGSGSPPSPTLTANVSKITSYGAHINISGSGFGAFAGITLSVNSAWPSGTASDFSGKVSNSFGSFTQNNIAISWPASGVYTGNVVATATDTSGNTASLTIPVSIPVPSSSALLAINGITSAASPIKLYANMNVAINVSGLTPSSYWFLVDGNSNAAITRSNPLNSSGSASMQYYLSTSSPFYSDLQAAGSGVPLVVWAQDLTGKTTNTLPLTL